MSEKLDFLDRLIRITDDIELGMKSHIRLGEDPGPGKIFIQIECERVDVITGKVGTGRSNKYYPSMHAPNNEIVQAIFGLYKGYWEHEARENFQWKGRRVYGPHIDLDAQWEAAKHIDVRSAMHAEDVS